MKVAMRNIFFRLMLEGLLDDTGLLLQVHDEVTLETPTHRVEYVQTLTRDEMEGAFDISVPIIAEGKSGLSWGANK